MNSTLLLLKGKISDVNLIELKGRLDRMASVGHYNLDLTPVLSTLKSPGIGLVLGFLFGWLGVDRFYKGDAGLGIFKILLCILPVFLLMSAAQNGDNDLAALASLIMCAGIIWCIADLFLVYMGIKKDNFKKNNGFFVSRI
jgi:TM2 domain family protein